MERDDLDKIAIIETNNDVFSDDTNRTIEQVVDAETGEIMYIPDQSVPLIPDQTVPVFRTKQNHYF